jgi:gliding motility-associated-like protein
VTVTNAAGCTAANNIRVALSTPVNIQLDITPASCQQRGKVIIERLASGLAPYQIELNGVRQQTNGIQELVFAGLQQGLYIWRLQDAGGCRYQDTIEIVKKCSASIYAPNVLVPDSGKNGYFNFYSDSDFEVELMQVFDRWGNKMAEYRNLPGNQTQTGWDGYFNGQVVMPGVYVYWARLLLEDGTRIQKQGEITVVR